MLNLFNKLKITFLFSLTLLFSLSFASITVNDNIFLSTELSNDYVINFYNDNFLLLTSREPSTNTEAYLCYFFDNTTFSSISKLGIHNNGTSMPYDLYALDSSNNLIDVNFKYIAIDSNESFVRFFDSLGSHSLQLSDFPFTVPSYSSYLFSSILAYDSLGYTSFSYTPFDIYEITSFNNNYTVATLGELLQESLELPSSIPTHEPFDVPLTASQINDKGLITLDSEDLKKFLPDDYTNYYIQYDIESDLIFATFFPSSSAPTGYIYDTENGNTYYTVDFENNGKYSKQDYFIYVFSQAWNSSSSLGEGPVKLSGTYHYSDYKTMQFGYSEFPVIYSNITFPFYTVSNGMINSSPDFTITPYNIINPDTGTIITANDVLNKPKDTNSIWYMIYSIFNPDNDVGYTVTEIENGHNSIIANADNEGFNNLFNQYKDYLTQTQGAYLWIITANNLLFSYFTPFLVLCALFLVISRVMR